MDAFGGRIDIGAPPHTRGKAKRGEKVDYAIGITPAYTGKRAVHGEGRSIKTDHPRIHGEKRGLTLQENGHKGSPPHTRGKVPVPYVKFALAGITPAYTGKRSFQQGLKL